MAGQLTHAQRMEQAHQAGVEMVGMLHAKRADGATVEEQLDFLAAQIGIAHSTTRQLSDALLDFTNAVVDGTGG
jgi:hypothetical protein